MWGTIIIGCYNVSSTLLCNSITHYFPFDVYYSLNAMQEAHQVLLQSCTSCMVICEDLEPIIVFLQLSLSKINVLALCALPHLTNSA